MAKEHPVLNHQPPSDRLGGAFWGLLALGVGLAVGAAATLMTPGMVGFLNDDGYYATTARALAAGQGYVHPFAPTPEPAYRYPILYPALLAATTGWIADLHTQLVAMQTLSLVGLALFMVLSALVLTRGLGLPPLAAVGISTLVGLHPHVLRLSTQVMSDLPFAALSMGALLALGKTNAPKPGRWLAVAGGLMGLMVVMRYQGVTLGMAAIAALLFGRRFRDAAWTALWFALPLLPWAAWVATRSGPWYQSVFRQIAGTYSDTSVLLAGSARFELLSALPSSYLAFLAPPTSNDPLLQHLPAGLALLGALVSGVMLWGAVRAAVRPASGLERVAAWYFLATLALVVVWNTAFVFLGFQQAVRLVLPLMPLALYFGVRTIPRPAVSAACLAVGLTTVLVTTWHYRTDLLLPPDRAQAYMRVFEQIRQNTPPEAVIGSTMPPMVYLYTGRRGAPYALQDPARFVQSVQDGQIDYLFLNRRLYGYLGTGEDVIGAFLADVQDRYPGLLDPKYADPGSGMEVWAVRRAAIAGERPEHRRLVED